MKLNESLFCGNCRTMFTNPATFADHRRVVITTGYVQGTKFRPPARFTPCEKIAAAKLRELEAKRKPRAA